MICRRFDRSSSVHQIGVLPQLNHRQQLSSYEAPGSAKPYSRSSLNCDPLVEIVLGLDMAAEDGGEVAEEVPNRDIGRRVDRGP